MFGKKQRSSTVFIAIWTLLATGVLTLLAWLLWHWRRLERDVVVREEASGEFPIEIPHEAQHGDPPLQIPSHGYGPLFHRRYRVDIAHPKVKPDVLMQHIKANLQDFCPATLAKFIKVKGDRTAMRVSDEYNIEILGPWNGMVRVVDTKPDSFSFVTLKDHPEAGEIRFRLSAHPHLPEGLRFEILSWARSRDKMVDLGYRSGVIGSEIQKNAWVEFCRRVAQASGGQRMGKIEVSQEEREFEEEVVPRE